MNTSNELEKIMSDGFSDKGSLIKQNDIQAFEKGIENLTGTHERKGYTLPPIDTIGMNLRDKMSCQIKNV